MMNVEETGAMQIEYGARPAPCSAVASELRPGALLLAVAGAYALTQRGLRPVRQLAETARRVVESGDLSQRVPVRGTRDDLDEVSELVNRMLEHNQRLVAAMRDSLDNVAHDREGPRGRGPRVERAGRRVDVHATVSGRLRTACIPTMG